MIFERICADDYDQIAPMAYVLMSCHAAQYPHLFSPPILVLSKRQFRAKLRQKTFVGIKAEESGRILGFCCGSIKAPKTQKATLHIDNLYVQLDDRRRGIGQKLIQQIKAEAINADCRRITLCVWQFNSEAMAFYKKLGFEPLVTTEEFFL